MDNKQLEERTWILARNDEYRRGEDTVSDPVFDARYERFCREYPDDIVSQKSVLEEIAGNDGDVEKLAIPMYSLNKKHYISEVRKWVANKGLPEDIELVASSKYDGLSLLSDEETASCNTRGDGVEGKIRNEHLKFMQNINAWYQYTERKFYTFGEGIISKKNWDEFYEGKINPRTGKLNKSARSNVVGLFNNKVPSEQDLKNVYYVRYGLVMKSGEQLSKTQQFDKLNDLNVFEVPYVLLKANDPELEDKLNELYKTWSNDFAIDGIVLEVNDANLREDLGRETDGNPAYAIAYKNPEWAEIANTPVTSIKIGISKQGNLNPVIGIKPVLLGGAQISNVTGYNMKYMFDNKISIGANIDLIRSGDVIPKHLQTTRYDETEFDKFWFSLKTCPHCGTLTVWNETNIQLMCPNDSCPERMLSKAVYFFSTIEIDNFGEGEIKKLFDKGYNTPEKILNITYSELMSMEGWAKKSIESLFKQFQTLKTVGLPLATIIQALDLFNGKLGSKVAQKIIDGYVGDENFDDEDDIERMCKVEGVAQITAEAFIRGFDAYINRYSNFPIAISYRKTPQKVQKGDMYAGFAVCMTGFRDAELEEKIVSYGGSIVSGVSKKTTHLLVKVMDSGSNKIEKALELRAKGINIEIMTREDFVSL